MSSSGKVFRVAVLSKWVGETMEKWMVTGTFTSFLTYSNFWFPNIGGENHEFACVFLFFSIGKGTCSWHDV